MRFLVESAGVLAPLLARTGQLDARRRSEVVVRHQPTVIDGRAKLLLVIGGGRHHHHHHHHHSGVSVVHAARRG